MTLLVGHISSNQSSSSDGGTQATKQSPLTARSLLEPISFIPASSKTAQDEAQSSAVHIRSLKNSEVHQTPTLTNVTQFSRQNGQDQPLWPGNALGCRVSKGLFNRRVSCYRNAAIQALLHTPSLLSWLDRGHLNCTGGRRCTACIMRQLSSDYWTRSNDTQRLNQRLSMLEMNLRGSSEFRHWGWNRQQDAGEFFTCLINTILQRAPTSRKELKELLSHRIERVTECRSCSYRSNAPATIDLQLRLTLTSQSSRLEQLIFKNILATSSPEGYTCDKCKHRGTATQYGKLRSLPDVLVIDLLRFRQVGHGRIKGQTYVKNNVPVVFGTKLDLRKALRSDAGDEYDLVAVVQHEGDRNLGHYRCVARNPQGEWECLDDAQVSRAKVEEATRPRDSWTPYMIFYERSRKSSNGSASKS